MNSENAVKRLKGAAAAAVFLGIGVLIAVIMSYVFTAKISKEKMEYFFDEKEDFDVLFFGASHVCSGIFPMELWKDYGITSYNFGYGGNRVISGYWMLKNALDHTTPKLVVVETRRMDINSRALSNLSLAVMDRFPLSRNKYLMSLDLYDNWTERAAFLVPFLRYHSRWTELEKKDFGIQQYYIDMGSEHYPLEEVASDPFDTVEKEVPADRKLEGSPNAREYLGRTIKLCKERGVDIMLTELPCYTDEKKQMLANGVADIAGEYGISYVNFHHIDGIVDFDIDMNDTHGHFNESGARKFTSYLGEMLMDMYDLPDRREDSSYDHWDSYWEDYYAYKLDRLVHQADLAAYLLQAGDDDFSLCLFVRGGSKILSDERMKKLIANAGQLEGREMLEEAAESGRDYFFYSDTAARQSFESAGGREVTAGNIEYSGGVLHFEGGEEDLLDIPAEEEWDVKAVLFDKNSSQVLHRAIFRAVEAQPRLELSARKL